MERMRPALQKLLARPSSLELLRYLVGTPTVEGRNTQRRVNGCTAQGRCGRGGNNVPSRRGYATAGIAACAVEETQGEKENTSKRHNDRGQTPYETSNSSKQLSVSEEIPIRHVVGYSVPGPPRAEKVYGQWREKLWAHEQLEFESSLDTPHIAGQIRLLDTQKHENDMHLWLTLLHYRKRIYGRNGILTFLNAITQRGILIPTKGSLGDAFWSTFLGLGFHNLAALDRIIQYADFIWKTEKRRWSKLYAHIIRFFLENGEVKDAVAWHNRLFQFHPPSPIYFAEMCRHVVYKNGDLGALKTISLKNEHRNVYSKVIPLLCEREDFRAAMDWHFFFLEKGDLPPSSKAVEPLVHYLAIYEPDNAVRVTQSIVKAGVSFAPSISKELKDNTKISREIMNLIHGETLGVSVKKYNDNLGARWFATQWISLDIAINGVHALGVQEIGPLSLQAIALRNPEPHDVWSRITQLRRLGISIGTSLYARAIEDFASRGDGEYLQGLLSSDQHPDALEDPALQEELLSTFARARDWTQYRRTLRIRSLASKSPKIEKSNLELRTLFSLGDQEGVQELLDRMKEEKCPVKSRTISHLIRSTLHPRQRGRRPAVLPGTNRGRHNDINRCIKLLRDIMESGSFVPVIYWRDIIRRLGMLGRFEDLQKLVLFLAKWYSSKKRAPTSRPHRYHVPSQVPTNHHLHPLRIIFNLNFQRAVVEWGFIWSLRREPRHHDPRRNFVSTQDSTLPSLTSGITLLKQLSQQGVWINGPTVRNAIIHRLIIYYGPGHSHKPYNRLGKLKMRGKMSMAIKQIDDALSGDYFSAIDTHTLIQISARSKMRALERRKARKLLAALNQAPMTGKESWYRQA
jgi:hypothetical protein